MLARPPGLITFDCTGTLFELKASVGTLYKQAVVAEAWKHGIYSAAHAEALNEKAITQAFVSAFAAADNARPCFGAGLCTSEEWWSPVVQQTIMSAAAGRKDCSASYIRPLLPASFDVLYHDTFVSRNGWILKPHVINTLAHIRAWRDERVSIGVSSGSNGTYPAGDNLVLGVISNWDDRLPQLLKRLGLASYFDFILTSGEVGVEKPEAAMFTLAQKLAGVPAGSRCVHVGDSFSRDVLGAFQAGHGWEPVFVCNQAKRAQIEPQLLARVEHAHLESLRLLPEWLGMT
eukprot:CAMPEP_0119340698 /NCGR_PEP_ID=MMETSP1333-20130426/100854_1 /TAXON_ID=418940 /ORGANISM="Scyphosphaera apsteinii, Strain RCC1455" /LENGTH=288 /DNA_ID=CAMNT_0007352507 /DNA_START=123 /DNA_END=989 /DNA_ORIENTATION=+